MNMVEKSEMTGLPGGRYNISLALVIEKFVFAIGGNGVTDKNVSDLTEIFDTFNN